MTEKTNKKRKDDDQIWSKNNGSNIRYRIRLAEEREAEAARRDALKDMKAAGLDTEYIEHPDIFDEIYKRD